MKYTYEGTTVCKDCKREVSRLLLADWYHVSRHLKTPKGFCSNSLAPIQE